MSGRSEWRHSEGSVGVGIIVRLLFLGQKCDAGFLFDYIYGNVSEIAFLHSSPALAAVDFSLVNACRYLLLRRHFVIQVDCSGLLLQRSETDQVSSCS